MTSQEMIKQTSKLKCKKKETQILVSPVDGRLANKWWEQSAGHQVKKLSPNSVRTLLTSFEEAHRLVVVCIQSDKKLAILIIGNSVCIHLVPLNDGKMANQSEKNKQVIIF